MEPVSADVEEYEEQQKLKYYGNGYGYDFAEERQSYFFSWQARF